MKEYKTPVIEEVNEDNAIYDVFESWGYCKAYVDRALAELSRYRLTGMTPGEIAEMRRDVNKMHGGWIPVEERLPEVGEYVLGTNQYGEVLIYHYGWNSPHTRKMFFHLCGAAADIIAWRPLPEPYRPERSNDAKE